MMRVANSCVTYALSLDDESGKFLRYANHALDTDVIHSFDISISKSRVGIMIYTALFTKSSRVPRVRALTFSTAAWTLKGKFLGCKVIEGHVS